jgi:hypothetical protein
MAYANIDLIAGRKEKKKIRREWEREVKRLARQKNLKPEDAEYRQIWRNATEDQ